MMKDKDPGTMGTILCPGGNGSCVASNWTSGTSHWGSQSPKTNALRPSVGVTRDTWESARAHATQMLFSQEQNKS
jgi:hypothetical protein